MAEKRKWAIDEVDGYYFAGIVPGEEHDFDDDETRYDVFNKLTAAATEDPEAIIGHLTAIVCSMGYTISEQARAITGLRKDLDAHGHKDAIVVKY